MTTTKQLLESRLGHLEVWATSCDHFLFIIMLHRAIFLVYLIWLKAHGTLSGEVQGEATGDRLGFGNFGLSMTSDGSRVAEGSLAEVESFWRPCSSL